MLLKVNRIMKVWIVMSKVQEIEARCVDKVFDSKEKADNYVREEEKRENLPNLSGFDRTVEEWEIE
jgi:Mg2+ and Co2+ transporter CorA